MPQEDVEVVRRIFAAFRERDLEAFLGYLDPDVEFRSLILEIEGPYHGFDGATEWWADLLSVFPDWSPSIEEARKVADRVIVRVRAEGRGTGSGVAQARDIWQVAEVRDGRVRSSAFFRTEREALQAASGSRRMSFETVTRTRGPLEEFLLSDHDRKARESD